MPLASRGAVLGLALLLAACGRVGYGPLSVADGGDTDGGPQGLRIEGFPAVGHRTLHLRVVTSVDAELAVVLRAAPLAEPSADLVFAEAAEDGRQISGAGGVPSVAVFEGLEPETAFHVYAAARRGDERSEVLYWELSTEPLFTPVGFDGRQGPSAYLVYKPEAAHLGEEGPFPAIVFLHGWGAAGAPVDELPMHDGLMREVAMGVPAFADFDFWVVAPVCDQAVHGRCWGWANTDLVDETLDHALGTIPIDPRRVYLTGLSTGGQGVFEYAVAHPDRVAAAVPIASTLSDPLVGTICAMGDVPVWSFHSSLDRLQPPTNSQAYHDALVACATPPRTAPRLDLAPWTGGANDHAGWVEVYGDAHGFTNAGASSIYTWMLTHTLP